MAIKTGSVTEQEVPFERQLVGETLRLLLRRVSSLSEADQKDFLELWNELFDAESEEAVQDIAVTMGEILSGPAGSLTTLTRGGTKERPANLQKWNDYVGQKIRDSRKASGLTQEQLAEKSGLDQSHISRIEQGELSPTRQTVERIAAALGVSVGQLDPSEE